MTLPSGDHKTMHADFFNPWDQAKFEELVKTCINGYDPVRARPPECTALGVASEAVAQERPSSTSFRPGTAS